MWPRLQYAGNTRISFYIILDKSGNKMLSSGEILNKARIRIKIHIVVNLGISYCSCTNHTLL